MTPGFFPEDAMHEKESPNQVMAGVLSSLRQSRALLLDPSPQNIDCCRMAVSQCVQKVGHLVASDRATWNARELQPSLLLVQTELTAIAGLLDSAAVFRRDMMRTISVASLPKVVEIDSAPQKVRHVHVLG
jgi:hypothetical protein